MLLLSGKENMLLWAINYGLFAKDKKQTPKL